MFQMTSLDHCSGHLRSIHAANTKMRHVPANGLFYEGKYICLEIIRWYVLCRILDERVFLL
jgi:hypothetical protein